MLRLGLKIVEVGLKILNWVGGLWIWLVGLEIEEVSA